MPECKIKKWNAAYEASPQYTRSWQEIDSITELEVERMARKREREAWITSCFILYLSCFPSLYNAIQESHWPPFTGCWVGLHHYSLYCYTLPLIHTHSHTKPFLVRFFFQLHTVFSCAQPLTQFLLYPCPLPYTNTRTRRQSTQAV